MKKMPTPNNNVVPFNSELPAIKRRGGDDGGDDMLEKRIQKLEDDLAAIRTDLAVIKSNYATKEDIASIRIEVHQSIAAQTKWLAATMLGITGLAMAVAKLIF